MRLPVAEWQASQRRQRAPIWRPYLPALAVGLWCGLAWPEWWQRWHLVWLVVLVPVVLVNTNRAHPWLVSVVCSRVSLMLALALIAARFPGPMPPDGGQLVNCQGRIAKVYRYPGGQSFMFSSDELPGSSRVFVTCKEIYPVMAGDHWRVKGIWLPQPERGSRAQYVQAIRLEQELDREQGSHAWAWHSVAMLRAPPDVLAALLLGQGRPRLSDHQAFSDAGLLHVLAVSGLHLGIALALMMLILRVLSCPLRWSAIITGLTAISYCWLTGAAIPTMRATIMCVVFLLAVMSARRPHPLAALSLAVIILLLWDPEQATQPGFQLSVAAVFGIVTLGRELISWRRSWCSLEPWPLDRLPWIGLLTLTRWLADGLAVGLAASLATMPIVAHYWGGLQVWSPIATVLVSPMVMLALMAGLLFIILHAWWPSGPWSGIGSLCEFGIHSLQAIAVECASWPGAGLTVDTPQWWVWPIWIVMLLWPIVNHLAMGLWVVLCAGLVGLHLM